VAERERRRRQTTGFPPSMWRTRSANTRSGAPPQRGVQGGGNINTGGQATTPATRSTPIRSTLQHNSGHPKYLVLNLLHRVQHAGVGRHRRVAGAEHVAVGRQRHALLQRQALHRTALVDNGTGGERSSTSETASAHTAGRGKPTRSKRARGATRQCARLAKEQCARPVGSRPRDSAATTQGQQCTCRESSARIDIDLLISTYVAKLRNVVRSTCHGPVR